MVAWAQLRLQGLRTQRNELENNSIIIQNNERTDTQAAHDIGSNSTINVDITITALAAKSHQHTPSVATFCKLALHTTSIISASSLHFLRIHASQAHSYPAPAVRTTFFHAWLPIQTCTATANIQSTVFMKTCLMYIKCMPVACNGGRKDWGQLKYPD